MYQGWLGGGRGDPPMVMVPPSPPVGGGGGGIGFMLQASALESSLLGPPRDWDCEDCLFHFTLLTKKSHGAYHMDCILHCNAAFSCTALLQTPTQAVPGKTPCWFSFDFL